MCAILCNDPFWLRPDEVAELTPWQVRHLYLCPRDEDGRVIVTQPETVVEGERAYFRQYWESQGLRDDLIEKTWGETHG